MSQDPGDEDVPRKRELHMLWRQRSDAFMRGADAPISAVTVCGILEPARFVTSVSALVDCKRCLQALLCHSCTLDFENWMKLCGPNGRPLPCKHNGCPHTANPNTQTPFCMNHINDEA